MGYPEPVVNSCSRSGLFSSAGRSVFCSQSFSWEEGSFRDGFLVEGRCSAGAGSAGIMVCVVSLDRSVIVLRSRWVRSETHRKNFLLLCYAKGTPGASYVILPPVKMAANK